MLAFIIIFENRGAKVTSKTSLKHRKRAYFHMKSALHCKYIYASDVMYKTIQARVNTVAIPATGKCRSLYWELLKPLWVIHQLIVIYQKRLKEFQI